MIEIDSLNAYYGKSHILHGLSMEVRSDEIVALLGRNGAGKTTTIQSIMGLVPRREGEILFQGENIIDESPQEIYHRGISWIPEQRRVFSTLSVEENLEMGIKSEGMDRKADLRRDVFDLFPRLEERRKQSAGTLSGGEQQMLAIGRAMLSNPTLLIVDEPFEGLMPTLIPKIAETLDALRDRNISMLIAEQRTEETLEMADRGYIIQNGTIVHSDGADVIAADDDLKERYLGVGTSAH